MVEAKYDVVIIGAGAAGLGVGAVLAKKEGKKVLVVEKGNYVGGRLLSFVGKKNSVNVLGKDLDAKGFEKEIASVYARLCRATPDLDTMIGQGLLDGYTFEAGIHATFWGDKGRLAYLLNFVDKPIPMPGNEGFTILDPKTDKWYELSKGGTYAWMSPEANAETKKLLKEMATMTLKDAEKYELISFGQWLNERTQNREVYEYLAGLASIHMVTGEPNLMPAADFIKFMVIAKDIGMNLVTGSTGLIGQPGFIEIGVKFAEAIRENGGEILLDAPVEEVIIADKKAKGVKIKTGSGSQTVEADQVVCTVPIKHVFGMIPESNFPADFVKTVKERFWGVGMLSGFIGLKRNIIEDKDVNPKTWVLVPSIIKDTMGYIGDVDIIMFMSSTYNPELAPPGKSLWIYSIALVDKETVDDSKVQPIIDEVTRVMQRSFPSYLEDMEWQLWTASSEGYGICPPIGVRRPDVKSPWVEGLFFAGDGYGERRWGMGLDSAIHSAILCLDAVTGKDYSAQIIPEYHR
ncbi:phytoene desaturase family protein [Chloroflexota bacterium]